MPYFGLGSPNASKMRVHADDDSSTAAVAGDVGYNEEKKRSAAAEDDEIPVVAKKKIKGAAGEEDSQSNLIATKQALPVIALNMKQDKNYAKFVESYEESNISTAQKHYHSFWKDMAKGALKELKKSFRPVIDDKAAEKSKSPPLVCFGIFFYFSLCLIFSTSFSTSAYFTNQELQQCFYGRHDRRKRELKYQNRKVITMTTALSNNDSASEFTSEDDEEEEASSQKSTDTSSMMSQSEDEDVGKAHDKEIITADDTSAQNPSDASSMTSQPKDDAESRSEDDGSISSGSSNDIEQTPRKPHFTEVKRLELIDYFGREYRKVNCN
jgi:hypothetical protein